jgi:hypothetical protein
MVATNVGISYPGILATRELSGGGYPGIMVVTDFGQVRNLVVEGYPGIMVTREF